MSYPYLIQGDNITVVIGNKPHTVSKTHITYERVKEAIKAGDWSTVCDIIEPKKTVLNYGNGHVSIKGETLYWKDRELHSSLATRMITMLQEGFPIEPMVAFMENLMSNPSRQAVNELYGFLEKNNLPITPDGHFLAYKKVRDDYLDCHSGTMDNSIGNVVEMERNEVDDNRDNTCSAGLHFCAHSYLAHFGGARTVIVKINPRDVVSIPSDYNDAKGRACRYEVIGEVGVNPEDEVEFTSPVQSNANSVYLSEDADFEWEWDADGVDDCDIGDECEVDDGDERSDDAVKGSGIFHRGYSDGYNNAPARGELIAFQFYNDGYDTGYADACSGHRPQYEYVEADNTPIAQRPEVVNSASSAWPFPTK